MQGKTEDADGKDRGKNYEAVLAAWRGGELSGSTAARELGVPMGLSGGGAGSKFGQ